MEKYIDQINKKPVLEYTSENILKKRRRVKNWHEKTAAARMDKI